MTNVLSREAMTPDLLDLVVMAESSFDDFWHFTMDDRDRELSADRVSADTCDAVVVLGGRLYELALNEQTGKYVVYDLGAYA